MKENKYLDFADVFIQSYQTIALKIKNVDTKKQEIISQIDEIDKRDIAKEINKKQKELEEAEKYSEQLEYQLKEGKGFSNKTKQNLTEAIVAKIADIEKEIKKLGKEQENQKQRKLELEQNKLDIEKEENELKEAKKRVRDNLSIKKEQTKERLIKEQKIDIKKEYEKEKENEKNKQKIINQDIEKIDFEINQINEQKETILGDEQKEANRNKLLEAKKKWLQEKRSEKIAEYLSFNIDEKYKKKEKELEENITLQINKEYKEILLNFNKIDRDDYGQVNIYKKEEAIKEQQSKHKNTEKAQENTDAIDQQNSESPEKKNKTVSKSKEELHKMAENLDKFVLGPEDHIEENLTEKQKVYKDYGDIEGVEEEFQKDTIGTKAERENQEELDNTTKQELYKNFEGLNESETTAIEIQDNKNNKKEIVIKESTNEVIVNGNQEKSLQLNEILKNKAKIFNRSNVNQISKEITGNRFKAFLLKRKINPAVIRVLENEEEIKEYLTAIYNKETKELPFDLIHDMTDSKLNLVDKIKMKRFAKTENRLGAKVIGKGYDLNTALEAGTQSRESTEEKKENRFLSDIDQRDNPNVDPKKALEQAQEKAASVETIKIGPEDITIEPNEKD